MCHNTETLNLCGVSIPSKIMKGYALQEGVVGYMVHIIHSEETAYRTAGPTDAK